MKLKAKRKIYLNMGGTYMEYKTIVHTLHVEENYPRKTKKAFRKHIIDFVYNSTGVLYK